MEPTILDNTLVALIKTIRKHTLEHIVGSQEQHNMLETSQDNLVEVIQEHILDHIVESQEQQTIVGSQEHNNSRISFLDQVKTLLVHKQFNMKDLTLSYSQVER